MNICFVGGGNMASALIGGLLKRGFSSAHMRVIEIDEATCKRLHNEFGVRTSTELDPNISRSEVIVLAVKPQHIQSVAQQIKPLLTNQLVISIAAGIRLGDLARWTGTHNIVRAMPNTPALIRSGISGMYALAEVTETNRNNAQTILAAVGKTLWLKNEEMIDAVTAISGSGPAYVFYFIEAMQQAALELGFSEKDARCLIFETFKGATKLAETSKESVSELRAKVTSKNGTTERALLSMEDNTVKKNIIKALHAAAARSKELGEEFGKGK